MEFVFKNAFPISLTTVNFDAAVPDIQYFVAECTMRYDYFDYFIYEAATSTDEYMKPTYRITESGERIPGISWYNIGSVPIDMDLEKIIEMWERDSKIDQVMLDESSIKIPQLHQKYLTLLTEYTLLLKKKQQELKVMKHNKWLFYSGKHVPPDSEPFPYKVSRSEVSNWIEVDEDINRVEMKVEYYQTVLRSLEEILKQVHQLSYNIKNAITWRTFTSGGSNETIITRWPRLLHNLFNWSIWQTSLQSDIRNGDSVIVDSYDMVKACGFNQKMMYPV